MKIFLFLFYESAKFLVRVVRWVYYANRTLVKGERGSLNGPCILVSNHPGTLMDPLNSAVLMNRRVNFLANAGMFSTPFTNWFFTNFYCIKVERYVDTGGQPIDNKLAFKLATDFLTKGGCLYMAPEGGSYAGRHLHKLKTGPARIALNTEAANCFNLGLVILPIGLNYSDPGKFRSHLLSIIGEPIRVADFKDDWEADKMEAVRKLTDRLRERMERVLIDTTDKEEDLVLGKVEVMLQNEEKMPAYQHFLRAKNVLIKIQKWRSEQPDVYQSFKEKTDAYFKQLTDLRIKDHSGKGRAGASVILLLMSAPFFLLGYLIHFLPAYFTKKITYLGSSDPVWVPTYKVMGGLVIYPLTLFVQGWLLIKWLSGFGEMGGSAKWLYVASIIPAGLAADWFRRQWPLFRSNHNYRQFVKHRPERKEALLQLREEVLDALN